MITRTVQASCDHVACKMIIKLDPYDTQIWHALTRAGWGFDLNSVRQPTWCPVHAGQHRARSPQGAR